MKRVRIQHTPDEIRRLWQYAVQIREARQQRDDAFTDAGRPMSHNEFFGRCGELAVAKWLGVPYYRSFHPDGDRHDIGGYEVRTRTGHNRDLPTYQWDKPGIYILATLTPDDPDRVILHGWADLDETRIEQRWADHLPYPCFLTPQRLLHDLTTLTQ